MGNQGLQGQQAYMQQYGISPQTAQGYSPYGQYQYAAPTHQAYYPQQYQNQYQQQLMMMPQMTVTPQPPLKKPDMVPT